MSHVHDKRCLVGETRYTTPESLIAIIKKKKNKIKKRLNIAHLFQVNAFTRVIRSREEEHTRAFEPFVLRLRLHAADPVVITIPRATDEKRIIWDIRWNRRFKEEMTFSGVVKGDSR